MNDTATTRSDDAELFACLRNELFTAVVGDVLDAMGHRPQFLPPGIAPLSPRARIAGRAMPVLEADVFCDGMPTSGGPLAHKPFGLMLEALDDGTAMAEEVDFATPGGVRR